MWFAGEEEALQMFRDGVDIYKAMAAYVLNKPIEDITKQDRQLGKQIILGCGFQMSAGKFEITCKGYGIDIDSQLAQEAVKAYRSKYSGVPELWRNLEQAAMDAVTTGRPQHTNMTEWFHDKNYNFLFCTLPSGRKLSYYDPKIGVSYGVSWTENGQKRHAFKDNEKDAEDYAKSVGGRAYSRPKLTFMSVNSVTKQWERSDTYGGMLTENIVQATARDLLVDGMCRLNKKKYLTLMTIHDEIVVEVPEGFGSVEELEQMLSEVPAWATGLPIKAEGWRGKRYKK
jgi:DNA polymerase